MLLAAGYFDESTDGDFEDKVFTVGGYIASGPPAIQLDMRWRTLLRKYDLHYFKASELEAGIGEFSKFRDDPKNAATKRFTKREKDLLNSIKIEFIDLLSSQDDLVGISATVHMRQLKSLETEYPNLFKKLPRAYQLCAQLVMMEAGHMMNETQAQNPPNLWGVLRPVFDSHKQFGPPLEASFDEFSRKNPNTSKLLLPPIFEDEKGYLCLQAADLLAYEVRRTISNFYFEPGRELRKAMQRLFPQIAHTYVLDYPTLKFLAESQTPDQINIQSIENKYAL